MNACLFEDVATVYNKNASAVISRHRIEHPDFGRFCINLSNFCSILGELNDEEYWWKFVRPLKRLRFDLCAAPFRGEYRFRRISETVGELGYHLRFCERMYPDIAEYAFTLLDLLEELLKYSEDPLLDKLLELTPLEQKTAWVVKESRLIPFIEELVTELHLPRLEIVHHLQLKDLRCYDRLIVIGPSRWFSDSVFTAARASQIDIVIFDWINDRWKPQNVFVNSHRSSGPSNREYLTVEEYETNSRWNNVDAESILAILDKASVASALDKGNSDDYENVEAICVFLEDDWAVFIEATTALIIEPDEEANNRVVRIPVREIRPGMFILVRTRGGGDYIVPIANKIMGKDAQRARECQQHWKELLRNHINRRGLFETSIDLLDQGSNIANETNVRNWVLPRSIRTQKYEDFLAIMKLVGLENEAEKYWNVMKRIDRAHHKAGFEIRDMLLKQAENLDIVALQRRGRMDFRLSSDDEGRLTAFRVEGRLPETLDVPYSRIGQPFRLEDQLWRE